MAAVLSDAHFYNHHHVHVVHPHHDMHSSRSPQHHLPPTSPNPIPRKRSRSRPSETISPVSPRPQSHAPLGSAAVAAEEEDMGAAHPTQVTADPADDALEQQQQQEEERIVAQSRLPSPPLTSSPPRETDGDVRMTDPPGSARDRSSSAPHIVSPRASKSFDDVRAYTGTTIQVRDLAHVRALAAQGLVGGMGGDGDRDGDGDGAARVRHSSATERGCKYEISGMPIPDIIEMCAGLLTKITATNDRQHETLQRPTDGVAAAGAGAGSMTPLSNSVLAFHGKNVPSITILSYLSRIHKYCPTTYEVFLSLLIFFDRMTERVNAGPLAAMQREEDLGRRPQKEDESERRRPQREGDASRGGSSRDGGPSPDVETDTEADTASSRPSTSYSAEGSDLADSPPSTARTRVQDEEDDDLTDSIASVPDAAKTNSARSALDSDAGQNSQKHDHDHNHDHDHEQKQDPTLNLSHFFVVDSFNIHRLVIAGVTCASKFFSDVFYTNSRYAKVGGLPVPELNHLELQFLLLNDFRLSVPVEELEAYGTMLVEFYAREALLAGDAGVEVWGAETAGAETMVASAVAAAASAAATGSGEAAEGSTVAAVEEA